MVKQIYFTRLADRRLSDVAYLERFTGQYNYDKLPLLIYLKEGKLFASIPGQEFELIPYQGTEFTLKGMTGFSIAFKQDENKRCSEVVVTEPGMVSTSKRKG
jgi:hypothetical protein